MELQHLYFIKHPGGLEVEPVLGTGALNSNLASLITVGKSGLRAAAERFAGQ